MRPRIGPMQPHVDIEGASPRPPVSSGTGSRASFASVLRDAVKAADRTRPTSVQAQPGTTDAARSLALQAEVYRHAERVELVSRLVDHAVGAAKTLLQTRF